MELSWNWERVSHPGVLVELKKGASVRPWRATGSRSRSLGTGWTSRANSGLGRGCWSWWRGIKSTWVGPGVTPHSNCTLGMELLRGYFMRIAKHLCLIPGLFIRNTQLRAFDAGSSYAHNEHLRLLAGLTRWGQESRSEGGGGSSVGGPPRVGCRLFYCQLPHVSEPFRALLIMVAYERVYCVHRFLTCQHDV